MRGGDRKTVPGAWTRTLGVSALALCGAMGAPQTAAEAALPVRLRGSPVPSQLQSSGVPTTLQVWTIPAPFPPQQLPPPLPGAGTSSSYALDRESVRRVIWMHLNQVKYCYQQALMLKPGLAGRMVVQFQITPQGQVQDLSIQETTLRAPELLQCVGESMRGWTFPPAPYYAGTTQVTYPFVLRPKVPEPPPGIDVSDDELARLGIYKDPEPPAVDIQF